MTGEHYKNEMIEEKRKEAGLTQAQLAEKVNVHPLTIIRVEAGKVCSFELLYKIAEKLGQRWQDLMRIDSAPTEKINTKNVTFAVDLI